MFDFLKRKRKIPLKFSTFYGSYNGTLGDDSTSFAGIDLIANSLANLSFDFYNFNDRSKNDHYLKNILNDPNPDDTKFQFFYNSVLDYYNLGNIFWYKYCIDGKIVSLFRLNPNEVTVQRDSISNEKIFYYKGTIYNSDTIIHLPSRFGNNNGLVGNSIFSVAQKTFKNAAILDEFTQNSFNNNVGKKLIIDLTSSDMDNDQIKLYKEKFIQDYSGVKNSGVPLLKRKGVDFQVIDSSNPDNRAQELFSNRQFQEHEIAKILRIPIELLNGNLAGKDIEGIYTLFLDNAIRPLATSIEQLINKYLLDSLERQNIYFEYKYNGMLKTSLQTRIETYVKEITNGILSIDEVRQRENLSQVEAGDTIFVPANSMPLRKDIVNSYMAGAKLKENLLDKSNSEEYHNETPKGIGDDKL
jgi:HK97 family phage portal protein